jgi:RNA polymerase sigma factor (sigma-70 family)
MTTDTSASSPPSDAWFVATHWSVVLSARDKASPQSDEALEALCRAYWCPLYAYIRRQGRSPHDAQDLTQEFFARLVHKDYLHAVDREKGRFRTFLLVALKRFLADEQDHARAQKRGGGVVCFSLDAETAERKYRVEPVDILTPEKIYERHWALALLDLTMARLRKEFAAAGKSDEFDSLKAFLTSEKGAMTYADAAPKLGLSEGALRVAVHRLRRRYRESFREEIAQTVASPEEIEDEVRHLMDVLGG